MFSLSNNELMVMISSYYYIFAYPSIQLVDEWIELGIVDGVK